MAKRATPPTPPSAPPQATVPFASDRLVTIGWYVAAALTFWSYGFTVMRGSDLWWHIAGGRWMTEHRSIWVPDPYSYSAAGQRWINDAWLSDVLLYLWTASFGLESLAYWKWILIVATWLLLFRFACRVGAGRIEAYVATTFGLAVAAPFLDVRPQLYGFLCWVLVLDVTLGRERPGIWLPAVYLLWVNLHASVVFGVVALPLVLLPSLLNPRERTRALALGAACLFAIVLNPNGVDVVLRPLRYFIDATSPFRTLGEWLPPFHPGGISSWLYPYAIGGFGIATIALLAENRADRRWWALIALGALTLMMSLQSRRFVPMFGISATPVIALALARWSSKVLAGVPSRVAVIAAAALGVVWLAPYPLSSRAFHYLVVDDQFPAETLDFASVNHLSGNVFSFYNWGGYVHLRGGGRLKVFVDGRSETVYADEVFLRYMSVLHQKPGWIEVIEDSGADFVLWPSKQEKIAAELVGTGRWRLLYHDHVSQLLVRQGVALPERLAETPASPRRWLKLATDEMEAGDPVAAQQHLELALAAEPDLQSACMSLVELQLRRDDLERARAAATGCKSRFPDPARDAILDAALHDAEAARRRPSG